MKKCLLILLLAVSFLSYSQNGERLQALKIAYLTKKLDLSPEEAQRFWPIYNKYTDDIRSIHESQKQKPLSQIEIEEKVLNVRKRYNEEFAKALSPEKVNMFFRSEKDFTNIIQRELQERRMNRQLNKRGPPRLNSAGCRATRDLLLYKQRRGCKSLVPVDRCF